MIPVPPLDGGNVLAGPAAGAARARHRRKSGRTGFLILYALDALRDPLGSHWSRAIGIAGELAARDCLANASSRACGRRAGCISAIWSARSQNWVTLQATVRLLLLRRRLARADERLRATRRRSSTTRSTTSPTGSARASIPSGARSSCSRSCPSTPSCTCCCRWSRRFRGSSACRRTRSRSSSSPIATCRTSASSATRCCRRPTSSIYDAHFVPVGEDQVPHLELSREVVRRFHNFYGEVLRRAAGAADADAAAARASTTAR